MEQYADLIANQGLLADIYNKQRKEYMTAKNREEKRREKEKRRQRKLITSIKKK